jgi:hypothetical protein
MWKLVVIVGVFLLGAFLFMYSQPYQPASTIGNEPAWVRAVVFMRDGLLHLHLLHNNEDRGPYVGQLKPGLSVSDVKQFLEAQGFAPDPFAWEKTNEAVNYRKTDTQGYQYHVTVFNDDEGVYGHHEFIPEEFPLRHWEGIDQEPRHAEFIRMLAPILATSSLPVDDALHKN